MGFLSRLNSWQKGLVAGFLFTAAISAVFTAILIFIDIKMARQGAPHMCFAFTGSVFCSLEDAILSRLGFMLVLLLVFGVPTGIFGAFIGYLIDKTTLK